MKLRRGTRHHCVRAAGGRQSLENTGSQDIEFLCLVDPAWKAEDERILE